MAGAHQPFVLTRRRFLQATGGAGVMAALPAGCEGPPQPSHVLSGDERRMLAALADAVLPPDDDPGGSALGTVEYVEQLLGAFEGGGPLLFAGGPYSGRYPHGDGLGGASRVFPPNDFLRFVPIDRVTEAAWRIRLYGSADTPGLIAQVKDVLARAIDFAPAAPETLDADQRSALLARLDQPSIDLLVDLVTEACFGAPEYGGNKDGAGWKLCHFEGDVHPLGYSMYDLGTGTYRERADAPVSTPSTSDPDPLDDDTRDLVTLIVEVLGGEEFK